MERVLESEAMGSAEEAEQYDLLDHAAVNQGFVEDLANEVSTRYRSAFSPRILDTGTGTAQIPIALCCEWFECHIIGVDLAAEMLRISRKNVDVAGLMARIALLRANVAVLPFRDELFDLVISNSLVHHVAQPAVGLAEMCRVLAPTGLIFVRDLIRPDSMSTVRELVRKYAGSGTKFQQGLLDASLQAALTLEEIRHVLRTLPVESGTVAATSDRHWTLIATR